MQSWVPLPQGALHLSWYLQPSSCAPSPPRCSHFTSAVNANLELPFLPATVGLLPTYPSGRAFPSHEEIISLSSLYTFNVWQDLFSVTAEFLQCTALCLQSAGLFLHGATHLFGTALWFCIALYIEGSCMVLVIITGMQIYYLVFSNSVGAHVYLVHLSAVFK